MSSLPGPTTLSSPPIWNFSRRTRTRVIVVIVFQVVALFYVFYRTWDRAANERLQHTLWPIAGAIAEEFRPYLAPQLDDVELSRIARQFLLYNPNLEIYVLDNERTVLTAYGLANLRAHSTVPSDVIARALSPQVSLPFYGPDPQHPPRSATISVAAVSVGQSSFYVYVVLQSQIFKDIEYKNLFPISWHAGVWAAAVTLLLGLFLKVAVIDPAFEPFGQIMIAVEKFEGTELSTRAPDQVRGELGELSAAINQMRDRIADSVVQLQERDTRRTELIANIWHDVRAPLAGISSLAQVIQRRGHRDQSHDSDLTDSLLANTSLLSKLVSDLQELGQLETGDLLPKLQPVSLVEIVDEIMLAYQRRAADGGISLEVSSSDALPQAVADEGMIARVLSNLLENALRYTSPGGTVRFQLFEQGERIHVAIEDNGGGIAPEDLPRIFERHFQSSAAGGHGLSGLGLSIVKKIVEQHGGTITVSSTPGTGTRFEISLQRMVPSPKIPGRGSHS